MSLSDNLKSARTKKKITQEELANILGKSKNVISNWERGDNKPDADTLFYLCDVLDVDANFLLGWTENKSLAISINEQTHIKKYRTLDDYGKKQVDTTLENEYHRCNSYENHFTDYPSALEFMQSRPMYGAGGIQLEKMEQEKVIKWANDFYGMEQDAKNYID